MGAGVLGGPAKLRAELEARLEDSGNAWRVVIWDVGEPEIDSFQGAVLEAGILGGLRATHTAIEEEGLARLIHVVALPADVTSGQILMGFVGAFAKSLARELASTGCTVNSVGADLALDDGLGWIADACAYLLSADASFVTGQSLVRPHPRRDAMSARIPFSPGADRRVLVSGGAGAIGSQIVRRLHADGWSVLIGHTSSGSGQPLADELDATGATCGTILLDVTSVTQSGAAELCKAVGPLDAVVLCGGWNRTSPFLDTSLDEWQKTLAINLTGPVDVVDALRSGGSIANAVIVGIGSESAKSGDRGRAVYAGAKSGLATWLQTLDDQTSGLHAATVAPGPVDTPLMNATHASSEAASRQIETLRRLVPLRRLGTTEDVAGAVSFLLTPRGSAFYGVHLSVGGGITMQ